MEELCQNVWQEINRIKGEESYEDNRETLLSFIEWGNQNPETIYKHLSGFAAFADRVFFILMIERSSHGKQVMQLFKNEEQVKAVSELIESGVDFNQLVASGVDLKKLV